MERASGLDNSKRRLLTKGKLIVCEKRRKLAEVSLPTPISQNGANIPANTIHASRVFAIRLSSM
jgi:hypothetical protein